MAIIKSFFIIPPDDDDEYLSLLLRRNIVVKLKIDTPRTSSSVLLHSLPPTTESDRIIWNIFSPISGR